MNKITHHKSTDGSLAYVFYDDDGQISTITLWLKGEIPTKRSVRFNMRDARSANLSKTQEQMSWLLRLCAVGSVRVSISEFQRQNVGNGLRTAIDIQVARKRKIKDKKNLYVAVDEFFIDPLVRRNLLYDDCEGNIELTASQIDRSEDQFGGESYLFMRITAHHSPCSKSMIARLRAEQDKLRGRKPLETSNEKLYVKKTP